jgi:hypothetical protein
MHRFRFAPAAAGALTLVVLMLAAAPAWAHEHRPVGDYELTVGWQSEPTYAGYLNGVQLTIKDRAGKPVASLGEPATLKVQVTSGSATTDPLPFEAAFGSPGEFDSPIIPTRPGVYTFRIFGTINGAAVDEKFTSSDATFESVREPSEIQFPAKDPSIGQLATSVQQLTPRVDAAVKAQAAAVKGAKDAKDAKDKASTATTIAIIALALGAVGVVFGVRARRRA